MQRLKKIWRHSLLPAVLAVLLLAGMIGLLDAVSRFDASQGTMFETFAMQRVRGAMLDELRGGDWMPRSVRRNSTASPASVRRTCRPRRHAACWSTTCASPRRS